MTLPTPTDHLLAPERVADLLALLPDPDGYFVDLGGSTDKLAYAVPSADEIDYWPAKLEWIAQVPDDERFEDHPLCAKTWPVLAEADSALRTCAYLYALLEHHGIALPAPAPSSGGGL